MTAVFAWHGKNSMPHQIRTEHLNGIMASISEGVIAVLKKIRKYALKLPEK